MSYIKQIIDDSCFIRIVWDNNDTDNLNKESVKFSITGNDVFINDNSGFFQRLNYSLITSPATGSASALLTAIKTFADTNPCESGGGGGGATTADNGLTMSTATNVQLGGTLLKDTTVDGGTFAMTFTSARTGANATLYGTNTSSGSGVLGTATSGDGVAGSATSGVGVAGIATSGIGITANSTTSYAAIFGINPATTNTTPIIHQYQRQSSGTAAAGIGMAIDLAIQTNTGVTWSAGQIISKWTTATEASRVSQWILTGVNAAVTADIFTLSGSGALQLNKYGVGTFTGTTAYDLKVDSSGNIIEVLPSGTYTPTLTGVANVSASTARVTQYYRVGNMVTVFGTLSVTATTIVASPTTTLGISLPIASNFANLFECSGNGSILQTVANSGFPIGADAANDRAQMSWKAVSAGAQEITFSFSYQII